ncbi:MAG: hypothetical protein LBR73_04540 [Oscillospiraceae bacterium]|jgi:hypothetical protein|nr:hypothetical protein [Oscillospiraceae bacterium]
MKDCENHWLLEPNPWESEDIFPRCPCCGCETENIYLKNGAPIGCDWCLTCRNAAEWLWEERERRTARNEDLSRVW